MTYRYLAPTDDVALISMPSGGHYVTEVVVALADEEGRFAVRGPITPREVARLLHMFHEANLQVTFTTEHEFLVALDAKDTPIAGLFYRQVSPDRIHGEDRRRPETSRQGRVGRAHARVHPPPARARRAAARDRLLPAQYMRRYGFRTDPTSGGLVRDLDHDGIRFERPAMAKTTWKLIDTTLREQQFAKAAFRTEDKLEIARALDTFGVEYIEVTTPAASPQSQRDLAQIVKLGLSAKIITHTRCILDDVRAALDAGVRGVGLFFATSRILREASHAKSLQQIVDALGPPIERRSRRGSRCASRPRTPSAPRCTTCSRSTGRPRSSASTGSASRTRSGSPRTPGLRARA